MVSDEMRPADARRWAERSTHSARTRRQMMCAFCTCDSAMSATSLSASQQYSTPLIAPVLLYASSAEWIAAPLTGMSSPTVTICCHPAEFGLIAESNSNVACVLPSWKLVFVFESFLLAVSSLLLVLANCCI